MKTALSLLVVLLLASCTTPYTASIKQLDEAHRLGYIKDHEYAEARMQLVAQDAQWRQEANARVFAGAAASLAQTNAQNQAAIARSQDDIQANAARMAQSQQRHTFHTIVHPPDYPGGPQRVETVEDPY